MDPWSRPKEPKGPFRSVPELVCLERRKGRERERVIDFVVRSKNPKASKMAKPCLFVVKPGFGDPQLWDEVLTLPTV